MYPPSNDSEDKESWSRLTAHEMDYFLRQFQNPYSSTVAFAAWLKKLECVRPGDSLLDIGCGMGAVTAHLAQAFPKARIRGIEYDPALAAQGPALLARHGGPNVSIEQGDLYRLEAFRGKVDGVISTQTLSWMENAEKPLASFAGTGCRWLAVSSLFYDGPVSARIEISDYASQAQGRQSRESYYNVYSIPRTADFLQSLGFRHIEYVPFEIDIDLFPPENRGMGTFTAELKSGRRLQFSGPVLMNWYFLYAERGGEVARVSST
jgi:SAM-dependent methyltransferase